MAPGEARVVYIDHDPVAHAHSSLLLERTGDPLRHHTLLADLLDAKRLWRGVLDTGAIDPNEPVGLLLVAVVHLIPDSARPGRAVSYYRDVLKPGSFLALSHGTTDGLDTGEKAQLAKVQKNYDAKATNPLLGRTREEILSLFGDWELMPPGLVWTPEWTDGVEVEPARGDIEPARSRMLAGIARKRRSRLR